MQCAYRTGEPDAPARNGDLGAVLAEIEQTVESASGRGIGRVPIFADDEFNLPDEKHSIAVLRASWSEAWPTRSCGGRINPTPFSAELAELVRETNGLVSITVDSAAEKVLAAAQKPVPTTTSR